MTKLLIAEDDQLLRQLLEATLRAHYPDMVLVANGEAALEHLRRHPVDVLVTDWMMPGIDGIELVRRVRRECSPPPFIVMSTVLGSKEAREHALRSGADDFLAKPSTPSEIRACLDLAGKRHASSRKLPVARRVGVAAQAPRPNQPAPAHVVVAVATSTGGPDALHELFAEQSLPQDCVYLVTLHGPEWMFGSVVEALQRHARLRVVLAEDGARAEPGNVYFACKGRHLLIDPALRLRLDGSAPEHFLRPAADPMFRSVARSLGSHALAVVLTGMGQDGAAGAAEIAAAGGKVLVQDPATAVVGGMPSATIELGVASAVVPLSAMGRAIVRHVEALGGGPRQPTQRPSVLQRP